MESRAYRRLGPALFGLLLPLAGCVSVGDLWPLGSSDAQEQSRVPANAIEYRCANGKRLYVRNLENGGAVWVILPERGFRLDRLSEGRYGNGSTVLDIDTGTVTLSEGGSATYPSCQAAAAKQ